HPRPLSILERGETHEALARFMAYDPYQLVLIASARPAQEMNSPILEKAQATEKSRISPGPKRIKTIMPPSNGNGNRQQAIDLTTQGLTLIKQGQTEPALAKFLDAVEADPSYVEAQNNIGNCYRETRQPEKALQAYSRALEIAP